MSDQPDKGGDGSGTTGAGGATGPGGGATGPGGAPGVGGGATGEAEPSPAETFKQGMGLLWKAARATVDEIKHEVNKGGVGDSLKQAGRDLEQAANQAAKTFESFIDRVGPQETPPEQQGWPGAPKPEQPAWPGPPKEAEGDTSADPKPPEGDLRIQVDD